MVQIKITAGMPQRLQIVEILEVVGLTNKKPFNKSELTYKIWLYEICFVPLQPVRAFFGFV
jgi:hypothetical protein